MTSRLAALSFAIALVIGFSGAAGAAGPQPRVPDVRATPACCAITAIDPTGGVVTARETQTGRVFQFRVSDRALLGSLRVGQPVYADFATNQVALAPGRPCCPIVSAAAAPRPGTAAAPPSATRGTTPGATPCVTDPSQISAQRVTPVGRVTAGLRVPPPPPPPKQTTAPAPPAAGTVAVQLKQPIASDLSPQLCESLKTGTITTNEVTAILQTMEKEHASKTHIVRNQVQVGPVSYTYEYVLHLGGLQFRQKPGVGYCSDFDWRFLVRNISQKDFTVFSTTGEVGICFSPGFGLFWVPGLEVMKFPIPGLCFDDAALTKLDLRNVSNQFEDELVHLVNVAFAKLRSESAKICIIGTAVPPWFAPVIIPPSHMVAYCTSTRQCEFDLAKLAQAKGEKK